LFRKYDTSDWDMMTKRSKEDEQGEYLSKNESH